MAMFSVVKQTLAAGGMAISEILFMFNVHCPVVKRTSEPSSYSTVRDDCEALPVLPVAIVIYRRQWTMIYSLHQMIAMTEEN